MQNAMQTAGEIERDGYTFYWMLQDGEIHGGMAGPDRCFIKGLSGWYRTDDPNEAADIAFRRLKEMQK